MNYWAIQHIPTGNFLPEISYRAGYTWTEPEPANVKQPRLFKSQKNANLALKAWLAGKYVNSWDYEGEWDGIDILPKPHRRPEDMRIVEIELKMKETEG